MTSCGSLDRAIDKYEEHEKEQKDELEKEKQQTIEKQGQQLPLEINKKLSSNQDYTTDCDDGIIHKYSYELDKHTLYIFTYVYHNAACQIYDEEDKPEVFVQTMPYYGKDLSQEVHPDDGENDDENNGIVINGDDNTINVYHGL